MASGFYLYHIKEIPLSLKATESELQYKKYLKQQDRNLAIQDEDDVMDINTR